MIIPNNISFHSFVKKNNLLFSKKKSILRVFSPKTFFFDMQMPRKTLIFFTKNHSYIFFFEKKNKKKIKDFFSNSFKKYTIQCFFKGVGNKAVKKNKNQIEIFIGYSHSIHLYLPKIVSWYTKLNGQIFFVSSEKKIVINQLKSQLVRISKKKRRANSGLFFDKA